MWILVVMVLIMPFEKHPWLRITTDLTVIKLLGMVGLLWSAVAVAAGQVRLRLLESRQARAFFAFACIMLLSALVVGAESTPMQRLVNTAGLLPLVVAAVRSEQDLRLILKTAVLTLVLVFPYAFRNALRFGGRLGTGIYEPNYFALILVLLVPIAFVLARREPALGRRRLFYAALVVLVVECFLTGSRGGVLGLGVAAVLLVMRFARKRALALGAIAVFALALLFSPTGAGQRLRSGWLEIGEAEVDPQVDAGVQVSNTNRKELLRAGLNMVQAHPLLGVGLGKFKEVSVEYGSIVPYIAHNTYLELAAESGIPTLLAFVWLLYVTLASLRRAFAQALGHGHTALADLALALRTSLGAYVVSIAFLSAQFEKFFWLFAFLSICFERIASEPAAQQAPHPAGARAPVPAPAPWWAPERVGSGREGP